MIDRDHALPITRQAQLLGMSRGAVYYMPRPTGAADLALMRRIDELHLDHPFMGARQLRRQLQRKAFRSAGATSARSCSAWASRRWRHSLAPASARRATRSTRTCCASWSSSGRIRSGLWTRPTSRWRAASCT